MAENNSDRNTEFFPSAFKCIECGLKLSIRLDSFMITCCETGIICGQCLEAHQGKIGCRECKEKMVPYRIRSQFIRSIVKETGAWVTSKEKKRDTSYQGGNENRIEAPKRDILEGMYEIVRTPPNAKVRQVSHVIRSILRDYKHNANCKPYQNIEYICENFVKLRKFEGITITIHDILAFVCNFCAHGSINGIKLPNGEIRHMSKHGMNTCFRECCGRYLDRRVLQYLGGTCECGMILMDQLGVRLATEEENEWRMSLFVGKGGGILSSEIKASFVATFARLKIEKPQQLIWYLMSLGEDRVNDLLGLEVIERDKQIMVMKEKLNGEYGRHMPIQ